MKPLTLEDPTVNKFYENTHVAWTSGQLDMPRASKMAKKKGVKGLYKLLSPKKIVIMRKYFELWEPRPSEFLLSLGPKNYLLTNQRIFLNDRKSRQYISIELSLIQAYYGEGKWLGTCHFHLSNGEKVVIEKMTITPRDEFFNNFLEKKVWLWVDGLPAK